jgi:hypothetical protein
LKNIVKNDHIRQLDTLADGATTRQSDGSGCAKTHLWSERSIKRRQEGGERTPHPTAQQTVAVCSSQ